MTTKACHASRPLIMKNKTVVAVSILSLSAIALAGCAAEKDAVDSSAVPQVTVPNGSSPARANAAHAPMNDTEEMRSGWNHGNRILWVLLEPGSVITIDAPAQRDSTGEFKGYSRVKFGWWRGIPGRFTIEGRRLDASVPTMRSVVHPDQYGAFGFVPSYLYFPSEGYWEITGRIYKDDSTFLSEENQSLTFVVHVVRAR
jgi:hypothetical protein